MSVETAKTIRKDFEKVKNNLREEWCKNYNIKEWPKDIDGRNVQAHHIIPLHHGGPNEWWNIVPATTAEHIKIHSKNSMEKKIFYGK